MVSDIELPNHDSPYNPIITSRNTHNTTLTLIPNNTLDKPITTIPVPTSSSSTVCSRVVVGIWSTENETWTIGFPKIKESDLLFVTGLLASDRAREKGKGRTKKLEDQLKEPAQGRRS